MFIHRRISVGNRSTDSTMWMTPLLAEISGMITVAFPAEDSTVASIGFNVIVSPPTVSTEVISSGNSAASITVGTTCLKRMAVSWSTFSGFNKSSNVSAGILAKASLFGANTVNGPSPLKVSTSPAAFTAATRVESSGEATAASTIMANLLTFQQVPSGNKEQSYSCKNPYHPH